MKKFFMKLEDIWVATAFAEEGMYDVVMTVNEPRIRFQKFASLRSERSC